MGVAPREVSYRSLGELLTDLTDSSAQLVRDEIRLARTETAESLLELRRGAVMLGIGIGVALCACGAGLACIIMVLSTYVLAGRTWLAALAVTLALGIIGAACMWRARALLAHSHATLPETTTSLEDTASWLKHPARSAVR